MMNEPLISVLMTAYNREEYIGEAIESVLSSSLRDFELIIIDDCSNDTTVEIAKSYQARDNRINVYVNQTNLGDYPNRNRALSLAKGKYIKFVDSDDKIFPETLEIMFSEMMNNPKAGFAVSSREETKSTLFLPREAYQLHFFKRGLLDYGPSGTMICREKLLACGGFKEIRNVSDFDMWLRMAALYPVIELPKGLVFWREHDNQEIRLAPHLYIEHTMDILYENLYSPKCPLSTEEVKRIIRQYRHNIGRQIVKRFLKKFELKKSIRLWKINKLTVSDLF